MNAPTAIDGVGTPRVTVTLSEWSRVGPDRCPALKGLSFDASPEARLAASRMRARIRVSEERDGLSIETRSWVGTVDMGPLRICVTPKLPSQPFARLLRYAYGLRDLRLYDETRVPMAADGLQDLLVRMLIDEVEELRRRGLPQRYVAHTANLESPRGRVLLEQVARRAYVDARLPCAFHVRSVDWTLNRVLNAGLQRAAAICTDVLLAREARRCAERFPVVGEVLLDLPTVETSLSQLTRQTEPARSALLLIRLLVAGHGIALRNVVAEDSPGFLFDMNRFFQRLLSRFIRDHLVDADFRDEQQILRLYRPVETGGLAAKVPKPRPDFALIERGAATSYFDAKYRDLTGESVPTGWLYQLSIYALAAKSHRSVLLYAAAEQGHDVRIELHDPTGNRDAAMGHVILRPVSLRRLAALVGRLDADSVRDARAFALELVSI